MYFKDKTLKELHFVSRYLKIYQNEVFCRNTFSDLSILTFKQAGHGAKVLIINNNENKTNQCSLTCWCVPSV